MASTAKTVPGLADSVRDVTLYLESIINLLYEQSDSAAMTKCAEERKRACGNVATLLHCADRYLAEIKEICEDAQKGGAQ